MEGSFGFVSQEKEHKEKFLGPETTGWGEGLPREGMGLEKLFPWLESLLASLGFGGGGTWDILGILLGCPDCLGCSKSLCKKKFVFIFGPYKVGTFEDSDLN